MKYLSLLIACFVCLFCLPQMARADEAELRVAFFMFAPHAYEKDNRPAGAAVSYFENLIAPKLKRKVKMIGPLPYTRVMKDFEDGIFDAVLLLAKTPDRASHFRYPAEPFGYMESGLLVRKDNPLVELSSPNQLKGLRIGYAEKAWIAPFMRDRNINFDLITTKYATVNNLKKLATDRLDAVYNPDMNALRYALKSVPELKDVRLLKIPETPVGYYTVFHPKVAVETVQEYEAVLSDLNDVLPYDLYLETLLKY